MEVYCISFSMTNEQCSLFIVHLSFLGFPEKGAHVSLADIIKQRDDGSFADAFRRLVDSLQIRT